MAIRMHMPPLTSVRGQTLLTDSKPYLFRQSPVVAEMLDDMIVGGTVAVNQLVENGNFADATGWSAQEPSQSSLTIADGVAQVTVTTAPASLSRPALKIANNGEMLAVTGHVYFLALDARSDCANVSRVYIRSNAIDSFYIIGLSTSWARFSVVKKATSESPIVFYIGCSVPTYMSVGDSMFYRNLVIHDLTQMFGSTIADHVLALENQTAGSGIAWLKSFGFFTEDYYPYDSGSLLSVKTSAHKTVGFNQWDEEWEVGQYDPTTGEKQNNGATIRCANYIPVIQTQYYVLVPYTNVIAGFAIACWYDASKQFISYSNIASNGVIVTPPTNARYMTFFVSSLYGATYNNNICINISGADNGTYEPYDGHTYPLSDIDLRGIPKLTDGQIVYDGDTYASDGTVTRRFGIVDLGTLTWTYQSAYNRAYSDVITDIEAPVSDNTPADAICSAYPVLAVNGNVDKKVGISTSKRIFAFDSAYTSAIEYKNGLSGVQLVYELATPTTETADPYTNPQIAGTTEEYVDERTVPMPVGHTTEYFDMVQIEKIQMHMPNNEPIKMHMPTA